MSSPTKLRQMAKELGWPPELEKAADQLQKLKRENAALRADIHAHEQINKQLIEDKRRLDFLGQAKSAYYYEGSCRWRINEDKNTDGDTLRDAIDAARKEAQPLNHII